MTLAEMLQDDEPYQHKPMTGYGRFLFSVGTEMAETVRDGVVYEKGSPEAIADCQRLRKEAIRHAQTDPRFHPMTTEEARDAREDAGLNMDDYGGVI